MIPERPTYTGKSANATLIRKRTSIALLSLLALAVVGLLPSAVGAAAGDLDPSFGVGGKVVTDFGRSDSLWGLAFRPGQIVAVGTTSECCPLSAIALARYRLDGSLDPTFGGDGTVTMDFGGLRREGMGLVVTDLGGDEDQPWAVALQSDGRIVVAGLTNAEGDRDFAIARYMPHGTLDSSFDE